MINTSTSKHKQLYDIAKEYGKPLSAKRKPCKLQEFDKQP